MVTFARPHPRTVMNEGGFRVDLKMRLIDLQVMQGDDLRFISQFVEQLNLVEVAGLDGGIHVLNVHFLQRIYLVVLSHHLEYLTMQGCVCGYVILQ